MSKQDLHRIGEDTKVRSKTQQLARIFLGVAVGAGIAAGITALLVYRLPVDGGRTKGGGVCTDGDLDSYKLQGGTCGAKDCNDGNALIHPGASEQCGNSLDDNCDGAIDEGCPSTRGLWISPAEIMALPISGEPGCDADCAAAWNFIEAVAKEQGGKTWNTPNLTDKDRKHGVHVLAGALYYARTGDGVIRSKVRDGIKAGKETLDEDAEYTPVIDGALSLGRQLGGYVMAADLIDLKNFDPDFDKIFRSWLPLIMIQNIDTNERWSNVRRISENTASNWGAFAAASRIAVSIYLGDAADLDRAANVFHAWVGDRGSYPQTEVPWATCPGVDCFFQPSSGFKVSWTCDPINWVPVNPPCSKSVDGIQIDLNGVIVEDISRGGELGWPPGDTGISYSWEALQGVYVQAELLHRQGYDAYNWENQALKRAMDFMARAGIASADGDWDITSVAKYVPYLANYRYGTNYPTEHFSHPSSGRIVSYTDWTHQGNGTR